MISASKINTMRNFLPLFLSLITGCQADSEVKGCTDGWVEFTCKYPETDKRYTNISVGPPRRPVWSNKTDVWENEGRFSLYHDTKNKKLNMNIRRLQHNDFGKYQCIFQGSKCDTVKLELEDEKNVCQEPFIQTAYRTAKTTISCRYKGNSTVSKFFCRDNGSICENIVSTRSLWSNGTFNLTESNNSFKMSISNVSSQHAGVYWCGVERNGGCNRATLRKITLKVEDTITNFKRSLTIGQSLTYWCKYSKGQPDNQIKFICKGEDPSICEPLVTTEQLEQKTGRFSMKDDKKKRNITITVRDVTSEDTGTYWCGAKTNDTTHSNPFFHRLVMTVGCQADSEVKGCTEGWVEFTCKYPETDKRYTNISVGLPRRPNWSYYSVWSNKIVWSNKTDVWENEGRFSLYHDTKTKKLNMNIRRLQHNDFGKYQCIFQGSKRDTVKLELEDEKNVCQEPFIQTAYRTAKTTISCRYKGNSTVSKFFCRDNGSICENIVSTRSLWSNGTFNLTESNSSFKMSISNVSSQHAGVYWCGVERNGGRNRAALRNITLKVEDTITNFKRSPMIGQSLTYWCKYSKGQPDNQIKFICKGEDPSICEPLVTTEQLEQKTGRFSMKDDKKKRNITITVRDVTSEDTGTYWCGAKTNDTTHSNPFFHRLVMTVATITNFTRSPTTGQSLTYWCEYSKETTNRITSVPPAAVPVVIIVIVCVAALLLLLVLIVGLIYKRHSKNKRNAAAAAAQHNTEEYMYEELRVRPKEPDSRHAMDNIYDTANCPTNPSASMHYSTINFHHCSGEAGGEAPTIKPSSSMCEYSTVKDSHRPTDSTVNQPSSEDPLYTTVNKP